MLSIRGNDEKGMRLAGEANDGYLLRFKFKAYTKSHL